MTRKEAKELLPIIQAFAEGKEIEYYDCNDDWIKTDTPIWESKINYRIKPEPKYRPFKTQEECWEEMQKHQLFGWIKNNDTKRLRNINSIDNCSIDINGAIINFDFAFNAYNFADGTPFGIKEE